MIHYSKFDKKLSLTSPNKNKDGEKTEGYCQNIFTLDLEVTSLLVSPTGEVVMFDKTKSSEYYKNFQKIGIPYIWMLSVDETVYFGREMYELKEFVLLLNEKLKGRRAVMYVHNFSYEFQFLRNICSFDEVFARNSLQPINGDIVGTTFTIKCSYVLSSMKLENIPKQYNLPIKKMVGDLDYNKIRHAQTKLTDEELGYCENDCLIVYEYIKLMLKEYGSFKKIPLTSTGKIRKKFQKHITASGNPQFALKDWKSKMSSTVPTLNTFKDLVTCFAGGYTHANAYYSNRTITNVKSIDFTSSYPAVMVMEKYPVGSFSLLESVDLDTIDTDKFAYILHLKFKNIRSTSPMNYISYHKSVHKGVTTDNGRVFKAKELELTITEQDWLTIKNNYSFDSVEVVRAKICKKDYLPDTFVRFIIELYRNKCEWGTMLKRAKAEQGEDSLEYRQTKEMYDLSKAYLNSLYGMCVTNYIADEVIYDGEWKVESLTEGGISQKLAEMREKKSVLLPYQWGVWITAYARRNLWIGIEAIGSDVVYCDTDSIKHLGDYREFIDEYNESCREKLERVANRLHIDPTDIAKLGYFDDDGEYSEFRTLGAKKYSYRSKKDGKLYLTVSGVNKYTGIEALENNIENFKPSLVFNYDTCGKLMHSINDEQPDITVTDYNGLTHDVSFRYGICLTPTTYHLDMTDEYVDYIEKVSIGCEILNKL